MPHIIVKMFPGRNEEVKKEMTKRITEVIMETAGVGEDTISISIEEIEKKEWVEEVYIPEIKEKQKYLYKKPGYKPEDL